MSTEELTAEERDAYACNSIHCYPVKLLRLYDAALARAEAAEQRYQDELRTVTVLQEDGADHVKRAVSAESRLAAATALLDAIRKACAAVNGKYVHPDQLEQAVCTAFDNIRAILSAAPAQAAESE